MARATVTPNAMRKLGPRRTPCRSKRRASSRTRRQVRGGAGLPRSTGASLMRHPFDPRASSPVWLPFTRSAPGTGSVWAVTSERAATTRAAAVVAVSAVVTGTAGTERVILPRKRPMRPIVVDEVTDAMASHRLNGGFVRRSHRTGIAAATVSGLALTFAINVAAVASAGTTDTPVGSAPAIPVGAQVQAAAPVSQPISFDVVLRPRNQAALDAFTTAVSTPGSPQFRQFITPGEYASQFGPTPSTIANVSSRMRSLGLTVGTVQGSVLPVSGSLTTVGSVLHTSFRQYRLRSGR